MKHFVIAIDGPSASGKGTLAKKLADYFKIPYLNTGALYRLVAWRLNEAKISPEEVALNLDSLIKKNPISEVDLEKEELFSEEIGAIASKIARNQELRKALFDLQRDFATNGKKQFGGAVLDGRDTTTIICPDAEYKFFVTALVEVRAKRRFEQLQKKGEKVEFAEILQQLKIRDENDFNRKDAPLIQAKDAVLIDTSNFSVEESVSQMLTTIEKSNK